MSFPRMTLFCPGIPGAGKTVLTSAVVDYVEEKFQLDQSVGIAYFYCNFRQRDEHTLDNLLASLLKQLLDSRGPLPGSVQSLYDRHRRKSTRPTLRDLSKVLLDVASEYSRVFVLVDALDEYQISDRSVDKMLSEIFHLQKSCNVSYFATSRHNPNIESAFENCLRLEIRADTDDVRRYLLGHLDQLPSFVSQNPRLQSEIIDAIVNAVDGMQVPPM